MTEMERDMPFITGSTYFIEELKKRTFKSGSEVVKIMNPHDLTLQYLVTNGFHQPIILHEKEGLDLTVPSIDNWTEIEEHIGPTCDVEVIDVEKQGPSTVDFALFIKYMKKPKRHKLLNLISLECSRTRLGDMIKPPRIARELDWVARFWPSDDIENRPRVQKYCLISPKNAFTDFHIDFSGTSVWYHIIKGEKVFYVIRPTEENLSLYWAWIESSNRLQTFFADQVDECFKFTLKPGSTLFLPTGWIHAVLTNEDSLVYGGNFLHSLNIKEQIEIYTMETKMKTPFNYMFPKFVDLHWHAARVLLEELIKINESRLVPPRHLLYGLKATLLHLRQWGQNDPATYDDSLLKELSKQIRIGEKKYHSAFPLRRERESVRNRKKPVYEDFVEFPVAKKKLQNKYCDSSLKEERQQKYFTSSSSTSKELKQTDCLSSFPTEVNKPYALSNSPERKQNWHILNGGLKVVIKKSYRHDSSSSANIGFDENFEKSYEPIEIVEKEDVIYEDNSLMINSDGVKQSGALSNQHFSLKSHFKQMLPSENNPKLLKKGPNSSVGYSEIERLDSLEEFTSGSLIVATAPYKKRRVSDDINNSTNVVYQDDEYIYPSLELTDEEVDNLATEEKGDEPWNPKAKVGAVIPRTDRPCRVGKQKVAVGKGLEAAAASEHTISSKTTKQSKKKTKSMKVTHIVRPVIADNDSSSPKTNKPRKGLATAKQRLGKILKLHKMRR